ncbi:MAG: hypothetical protein LBH46_04050 [Rickettsiales bacterium]|nr:hypothetical protein [Rickettsiales bacterium]
MKKYKSIVADKREKRPSKKDYMKKYYKEYNIVRKEKREKEKLQMLIRKYL